MNKMRRIVVVVTIGFVLCGGYCGLGYYLAWRRYKTGPLIDAQGTVVGLGRAELIKKLGQPVFEWS